jgi:hypothetical protein
MQVFAASLNLSFFIRLLQGDGHFFAKTISTSAALLYLAFYNVLVFNSVPSAERSVAIPAQPGPHSSTGPDFRKNNPAS